MEVEEVTIEDRVAILEITVAALARAVGMEKEVFLDLVRQGADQYMENKKRAH